MVGHLDCSWGRKSGFMEGSEIPPLEKLYSRLSRKKHAVVPMLCAPLKPAYLYQLLFREYYSQQMTWAGRYHNLLPGFRSPGRSECLEYGRESFQRGLNVNMYFSSIDSNVSVHPDKLCIWRKEQFASKNGPRALNQE